MSVQKRTRSQTSADRLTLQEGANYISSNAYNTYEYIHNKRREHKNSKMSTPNNNNNNNNNDVKNTSEDTTNNNNNNNNDISTLLPPARVDSVVEQGRLLSLLTESSRREEENTKMIKALAKQLEDANKAIEEMKRGQTQTIPPPPPRKTMPSKGIMYDVTPTGDDTQDDSDGSDDTQSHHTTYTKTSIVSTSTKPVKVDEPFIVDDAAVSQLATYIQAIMKTHKNLEFTGDVTKLSLSEFLDHLDIIFLMYNVNTKFRPMIFRNFCKKGALRWYRQLQTDHVGKRAWITNMSWLISQAKKNFTASLGSIGSRIALEHVVQADIETVQAYYERLTTLADEKGIEDDRLIAETFIRGLRPILRRTFILGHMTDQRESMSTREICEISKQNEEAYPPAERKFGRHSDKKESNFTRRPDRKDKSQIQCHKCKQMGHYANECPTQSSGNNIHNVRNMYNNNTGKDVDPKDKNCAICIANKKPEKTYRGHTEKFCYDNPNGIRYKEKTNRPQQDNKNSKSNTQQRGVRHMTQGDEVDHTYLDEDIDDLDDEDYTPSISVISCGLVPTIYDEIERGTYPSRRDETSLAKRGKTDTRPIRATNTSTTSVNPIHTQSRRGKGAWTLPAMMGGKKVNLTIDTGADRCSCISLETFLSFPETLRSTMRQCNKNLKLTNVDGGAIQVEGVLDTYVYVRPNEYKNDASKQMIKLLGRFYILKNLEVDGLLGTDFIMEYGDTFKYSNKQVAATWYLNFNGLSIPFIAYDPKLTDPETKNMNEPEVAPIHQKMPSDVYASDKKNAEHQARVTGKPVLPPPRPVSVKNNTPPVTANLPSKQTANIQGVPRTVKFTGGLNEKESGTTKSFPKTTRIPHKQPALQKKISRALAATSDKSVAEQKLAQTISSSIIQYVHNVYGVKSSVDSDTQDTYTLNTYDDDDVMPMSTIGRPEATTARPVKVASAAPSQGKRDITPTHLDSESEESKHGIDSEQYQSVLAKLNKIVNSSTSRRA
jgi:hypothetical protein